MVCINDLCLGECINDSIVDGDRGIKEGCNTDAEVLTRNTDSLEYVVVCICLKLRIAGVSALSVSLKNKDLVKLVSVAAEFSGLGAYHKSRVTACGDSNTRSLKERPEACEISYVSVVGLGGVNDKDVKTCSLDKLGSSRHSFLILVVGNTNSAHFLISYILILLLLFTVGIYAAPLTGTGLYNKSLIIVRYLRINIPNIT